MNPYTSFVQDYSDLLKAGKQLPMGTASRAAVTPLVAGNRKALIFSPHPDDECIIGALPLRLLREEKFEVINVAVTQGSNKDRQAARLEELKAACAFMGYGLIQTQPNGLEKVSAATRSNQGQTWGRMVALIMDILAVQKPHTIFFPHEHDWNSTHIGTHFLVMDALKELTGFECYLVETEFWGQMTSPNLMVESTVEQVADLVAGTSFHVGEVTRNPFHVLLPAWMQDNVRRGSELVGGQGKAAPDYTFATLYRLRKWSGDGTREVLSGGIQLSATERASSIFS